MQITVLGDNEAEATFEAELEDDRLVSVNVVAADSFDDGIVTVSGAHGEYEAEAKRRDDGRVEFIPTGS